MCFNILGLKVILVFNAGRGSAQITLAEPVKSQVTLESEPADQLFVIGYSIADGQLDFSRPLFHQPGMAGFVECFTKTADESTFAYVSYLRQFRDALCVSPVIQHE